MVFFDGCGPRISKACSRWLGRLTRQKKGKCSYLHSLYKLR